MSKLDKLDHGTGALSQLKQNATSIMSDMNRSLVELYDHLDRVGLLSLAALFITIALVFLQRYIAKVMIILVLTLTSLGSIGNLLFIRIYY